MPTLTVTNTNDGGPGSLRQTIADAGVGDTIIFDLVLPATITLTSGELVLNRNLTIDGPGPMQLTISGGQNSRVFHVLTINTIRGLTITEGLADFGGGIFVNPGATLSLENVRLLNNRAAGETDSGGGAIAAFGSTASITNCTIAVNTAERRGGALDARDSANVLIRNSRLENNEAVLPQEPALGPRGGAVSIDETSSVRIENSSLVSNRVVSTSEFSGFGGAVYNEGTLAILRSTLSNNSARGAGAVSHESGTFTTINSTYSNNTSAFNGTVALFTGVINISFCTIANNANTGLWIDTPGGGTDVLDVRVKNSLVANNFVGNCFGTGTSLGVNMSTDATCTGFAQVSTFDLNLQPLALNPPGTTETHALGPGSVAINAAPDCTDATGAPVTTDQRGMTRPQGTACDIGAYEFQFLKNMNPPA